MIGKLRAQELPLIRLCNTKYHALILNKHRSSRSLPGKTVAYTEICSRIHFPETGQVCLVQVAWSKISASVNICSVTSLVSGAAWLNTAQLCTIPLIPGLTVTKPKSRQQSRVTKTYSQINEVKLSLPQELFPIVQNFTAFDSNGEDRM